MGAEIGSDFWMAAISRNDYLMGCLLQRVYFISNHRNICNLLNTSLVPLLCGSCPPDEFTRCVSQELLGTLPQIKAHPGARCRSPSSKSLRAHPEEIDEGAQWK